MDKIVFARLYDGTELAFDTPLDVSEARETVLSELRLKPRNVDSALTSTRVRYESGREQFPWRFWNDTVRVDGLTVKM